MKKILVLDDDLVAMLLYGEQFKREPRKYQLIKCFNGLEAIKMMESEKPDVIILDLHMPLINGMDVYEKIKSNNAINTIPIVVVTADVGAKNKYGKKLSGVTWMLKPVSAPDLFESVERALVSSKSIKRLTY